MPSVYLLFKFFPTQLPFCPSCRLIMRVARFGISAFGNFLWSQGKKIGASPFGRFPHQVVDLFVLRFRPRRLAAPTNNFIFKKQLKEGSELIRETLQDVSDFQPGYSRTSKTKNTSLVA